MPDRRNTSGSMNRRKKSSASRSMNRLMDEVYREMFLLEAKHPGAEMGLALALLRAWVAAEASADKARAWNWLTTICPICLKMIEESLNEGGAVVGC
jgi:hypothetical protein